jgi:metal-dependent amidase/aminoacylase/carboxypeptidase family protein
MIESNALQDLEELIGIHLREMNELRLGEANSEVYHAAAHRIKAVIKGRPAHGARPHLGVNTIEADVLGHLKAPAVSPGSEDFHFFTKAFNLKSVYVGLGADLSPGLHHPEMSFDLSALEYGRKILEKMILKRLG